MYQLHDDIYFMISSWAGGVKPVESFLKIYCKNMTFARSEMPAQFRHSLLSGKGEIPGGIIWRVPRPEGK